MQRNQPCNWLVFFSLFLHLLFDFSITVAFLGHYTNDPSSIFSFFPLHKVQVDKMESPPESIRTSNLVSFWSRRLEKTPQSPEVEGKYASETVRYHKMFPCKFYLLYLHSACRLTPTQSQPLRYISWRKLQLSSRSTILITIISWIRMNSENYFMTRSQEGNYWPRFGRPQSLIKVCSSSQLLVGRIV